MRTLTLPSYVIYYLSLGIFLTACAAINQGPSTITPVPLIPANTLTNACEVTEPAWAKPPEDSAVDSSPVYGYYYVNEDRSIWVSSWWTADGETFMHAGKEGNKVGWFRPAGVELVITGQRLDAQTPPLDAHVPCCYPTRFQATGLIFPSEGCWEVTAKAADRILTFVVKVEP